MHDHNIKENDHTGLGGEEVVADGSTLATAGRKHNTGREGDLISLRTDQVQTEDQERSGIVANGTVRGIGHVNNDVRLEDGRDESDLAEAKMDFRGKGNFNTGGQGDV